MKKYLLALSVVASAFILFAFTAQPAAKKATKADGYFFKYVGPEDPLKIDIQDRTNYELETESCGDAGDHVCGVILSTYGATPDVTEFNAVKDELWASEGEQSQLPEIIIMRE